MIDPPPAAAPSGDQLAMKNKGKKKKKIQKTTGISFVTLLFFWGFIDLHYVTVQENIITGQNRQQKKISI